MPLVLFIHLEDVFGKIKGFLVSRFPGCAGRLGNDQ